MTQFILSALTLALSIGCSAGSIIPPDGGIIMEQPTVQTVPQAVRQAFLQAGGQSEANEQIYEYQPGFTCSPVPEDVFERIYGLSYKQDCTVPLNDLRYVQVLYTDFNGEEQSGELICNRQIAQDLLEIFYELHAAEYPIEKIRLVDEYDADDTLSMLDNNTSCFNFRPVEGSKNLSKHALGLAIDINPFYNPYVTYPKGQIRISPQGSEPYADRSQDFPYKIDKNDLCYRLFTEHGFTWGGNWKTLKDYQHFQKAEE